ncbi:MAG: ABC transporter ATP-binding protein [Bacteroidota bacterium]
MSELAIKVENLSKSYQIKGTEKQGYTALRDVLTEHTQTFFSKVSRGQNPLSNSIKQKTFWALDDISFGVEQGEILGIIGRNGAGKSTLLKLLSRITEPDKGKITLNGRIASLLEVGTGFHPELTGRENIFLSGAILGMKRGEIKKHFDEIVEFAGVEKFLEVPVKRYSSGMYVRLGFAVAAHLETEILLVDEVLAVGDIEFQQKCIGKMGDVVKSGKTVLIVSHNMGTIKKLCKSCMVLEKGNLLFYGDTELGINEYKRNYSLAAVQASWENDDLKNDKVFLKEIHVKDKNGTVTNLFLNSQEIYIHFIVEASEDVRNFTLAFDIMKNNEILLRSRQVDFVEADILMKGEVTELICKIPSWFFNAGDFYITPFLSIHCVESLFDSSDPLVKFTVKLDPSRSKYHDVLNEQNHPGLIFPTFNWKVEKI